MRNKILLEVGIVSLSLLGTAGCTGNLVNLDKVYISPSGRKLVFHENYYEFIWGTDYINYRPCIYDNNDVYDCVISYTNDGENGYDYEITDHDLLGTFTSNTTFELDDLLFMLFEE